MSLALCSLATLAFHKSASGVILYKAQNAAKFSFLTATFLGEASKLTVSYAIYRLVAYKRNSSLHGEYMAIQQYASPKVVAADLEASELATSTSNDETYVEHNTSVRVLAIMTTRKAITLAVVALLYVMQNNAVLYASSVLRPTIMQAVWQLRIISTAITSTIVLRRRFSTKQIAGMALLIASVLLINDGLNQSNQASVNSSISLLGVSIALFACILSGVAGVLVEAVLKDQDTDLWLANCQMSIFSLIPAFLFMAYEMWGSEAKVSGFTGFSSGWAWSVVLVHGMAGLLVSFVTKFASSMAKSFSGAFAIIITLILSSLAGTRSGPNFPKGTKLLVLCCGICSLYLSTWLYAFGDAKKAAERKLDLSEQVSSSSTVKNSIG